MYGNILLCVCLIRLRTAGVCFAIIVCGVRPAYLLYTTLAVVVFLLFFYRGGIATIKRRIMYIMYSYANKTTNVYIRYSYTPSVRVKLNLTHTTSFFTLTAFNGHICISHIHNSTNLVRCQLIFWTMLKIIP